MVPRAARSRRPDAARIVLPWFTPSERAAVARRRDGPHRALALAAERGRALAVAAAVAADGLLARALAGGVVAVRRAVTRARLARSAERVRWPTARGIADVGGS